VSQALQVLVELQLRVPQQEVLQQLVLQQLVPQLALVVELQRQELPQLALRVLVLLLLFQ
jgi:hypothetical protein